MCADTRIYLRNSTERQYGKFVRGGADGFQRIQKGLMCTDPRIYLFAQLSKMRGAGTTNQDSPQNRRISWREAANEGGEEKSSNQRPPRGQFCPSNSIRMTKNRASNDGRSLLRQRTKLDMLVLDKSRGFLYSTIKRPLHHDCVGQDTLYRTS